MSDYSKFRAIETSNTEFIRYQVMDPSRRWVQFWAGQQHSGSPVTVFDYMGYRPIPLLRALLVMGLFFLEGCQVCSQDPSIVPHIRHISALAGVQETNTCNAEIVDDLDGNYGLASSFPAYQCDIFILRDLPPLTFRATIYHEFGHCVGLEHQPSGIMRANAYDELYYQQNWKSLEAEIADLISNY